MQLVQSAAITAMVFGMLVAMVGCENLSSSQRYKLASDTYSTAVEGVTLASRAGAVDLDTIEDFDQVRSAAREILDAWEQAIIDGRNFNGGAAFDELLDAMLRVQLEAERNINDGHSRGTADHQGSEHAYYIGFGDRGRSQFGRPRFDDGRNNEGAHAA